MKAPALPDPVDNALPPADLKAEGCWLILSDVHMPFHDRRTVELAVEMARVRKARGVLLNGDLLDCHSLSRFDRTPDDPRYPDEIRMGRQFLEYLRNRLPKARLLWKEGNHEERCVTYLISKAPELFGLDVLTLPNLLQFDRHGVEFVGDRRVIHLGKLNVIHGHEYRPAITAPVNPARGLFLRAKASALCGHHHQTSEHHEPDINGKPRGAWSTGCACSLTPRYMPLNRWNLGFALVQVSRDGSFSVENKKVIDGKVV